MKPIIDAKTIQRRREFKKETKFITPDRSLGRS